MHSVAFELVRTLARVSKRYLALTVLCLVGCSATPQQGDDAIATAQELTALLRINCGGGNVAPFGSDQFSNGGLTWTSSTPVSTTNVTDAAPASVYQSERYGNFTYTFDGLTASQPLTVRLHFAETKYTTAGARKFNVLVNGAQVLTSFDVFALVGANKALVRDFAATVAANGRITVQLVNVVDNARLSGIELLSAGSASNQAPTVATAASAAPSSVSGTSSTLSVLGADDGGEAALTYTWAATGTPPAPVTFSANGSNAAKTSTVTFAKAGSYTLAATIKDGSGATVTSSVNVIVSQKLASIAVSPSSATVAPGATQRFAAAAKDQFGSAMTSTPTFAWTASGGGSIAASGLYSATASGGPFAISAGSGGVSGSASVTVSSAPPTGATALFRVNCGGGNVSPFASDQFVTGGSSFDPNVVVATSGVANAAPAAVYSSERWGNHSYTFTGLGAGTSVTVRLHFAETKWTTAGARLFNVAINGANVLSNFDIFATAGPKKALVLDFATTASSAGQVTIQYVGVVDNAKSSGIEILSSTGGGSNQSPTVASAASATENPTSATTTSLKVLGADDGGEANLTYSWGTSGTPPAPVTFSINTSNAAKNTVATFSKAGSYVLAVTIRDGSGASVLSSVTVVVNQSLSSVALSPASVQVAPSATQQFLATARDQFGAALTPQPSLAWSVTGGGSISNVGLFTAGSSSGGPFQVKATSGTTTGSATLNVTSSSTFSYQTNFNLNEDPISEGGIWHQNGVDWTRVVTSGGVAYGTQAGHQGPPYDDSYAILSGWPPDHYAEAVIHLESGITAQYAEVEILLRWTDSAHNSIGYECNLAYNGQYATIGRWPGPLGTGDNGGQAFDFQPSPIGVQDGDIFSAQIVGYTITSWITRAGVRHQLCTATDTSAEKVSSGSPGIGFYTAGAAASSKFSLTSFSAHSL